MRKYRTVRVETGRPGPGPVQYPNRWLYHNGGYVQMIENFFAVTPAFEHM